MTGDFVYVFDNAAERAGGGIEANEGTTTLNNVVMVRNMTGAAPGNGGALHLTGTGTVTIDQAYIRNNTAVNEGGGVWNSATGTMTLTNANFVNNMAPTGPDSFNNGGSLTINGTVIP